MSFLIPLLSRDPSSDEWRFWYVVTYLTAKGSLRRRVWRPFDEARAFVHTLGLRNQIEWRHWAKTPAKPHDIPTDPYTYYKRRGWVSWGDWLGTGRVHRGSYRPFVEARAFARSLGLRSVQEWTAWARTPARPRDIPFGPHVAYRDLGWAGYADWLGTQNKSNRELTYRPFAQARAFVRTLGLQSGDDWWAWCRAGARPPDIPATPDHVYKDDGWSDWGDWLGTGTVATGQRRHRPFAEARAFVQGLGLRSQADWQAWAKTAARPPDIPAAPAGVYADCGWVSWGDWLGTGTVAVGQRRYRPFTEARASVRALGLRNCDAWKAWSRTAARPPEIPTHPHVVYKDDGWVDWRDWLGTARGPDAPGRFRSFAEARAFAQTLRLGGRDHWIAWSRSAARPHNIPARPDHVYAGHGWAGWRDWLGSRSRAGDLHPAPIDRP